MRDAVRFEWVRLRTIRSTWWLLGSGLALNALVATVAAALDRGRPLDTRAVHDVLTAGGASFPLPLLAVFLAVIGIFATGQEYRYGTIQPTLTTVPRRGRLLIAKVVVTGTVAVLAGVVSLGLNLAAGLIWWGHLPGLTAPPLGSALPGYVLLGLLWSVVGVALGQLFRGVPAALTVILVVPLVVEQVLLRLSFAPPLDWLAPAVRFLPFAAGQQLIGFAGEVSGGDETEAHMLARWPSGAVFLLFAATVLAGALALFRHRDA